MLTQVQLVTFSPAVDFPTQICIRKPYFESIQVSYSKLCPDEEEVFSVFQKALAVFLVENNKLICICLIFVLSFGMDILPLMIILFF